MDQEPDLTKKPPEEIRHEIDETRSSLTQKLETLEDQVRDTVHGAKETVEETIENVKYTVQDTVEAVKRTFDLSYQTQQHPWAMFGGSVATGFLVGTFFPNVTGGGSSSHASGSMLGALGGTASSGNGSQGTSVRGAEAYHASSEPGWFGTLLHRFDREIGQLKEVAIGAAAGLLRDWLKQSLPPALAPQVADLIDSATTKLGGRPVPGPVVENLSNPFGSREREPSQSHYANPTI